MSAKQSLWVTVNNDKTPGFATLEAVTDAGKRDGFAWAPFKLLVRAILDP